MSLINILLILCVSSCSTTEPDYSTVEAFEYTYEIPEDSDTSWNSTDATSLGLDVGILEQGVRAVMLGEYPNIHSILIAADGKLVFEKYFPGYSWDGRWTRYEKNTVHSLQSMTKSIVSLVIGVAFDRGDLEDLDGIVLDSYPEYERADREIKEKITLRHLLTMQSGLKWNEWLRPLSSPFNDLNRHYCSSDPFEYVLRKRLIEEPGTFFSYNTASVNLLGDILHRATGQAFADYAVKYLFGPLEISDAHWLPWKGVDSDTVATGGGLCLTPRDVLKIGQLVLQHGYWNGRQVVSAEWLEQTMSVSAKFNSEADYGFLWWLLKQTNAEDGDVLHPYVAGGNGGQWLFIYPEREIVVVTTGGNYGSDDDVCYAWVNDYVIPAMPETNSR